MNLQLPLILRIAPVLNSNRDSVASLGVNASRTCPQ